MNKMKKGSKKGFLTAVCLLAAFVLWTVLVRFVVVERIGPLGSRVGFSALNGKVHAFTGVNMVLYSVTDWLGLVPVGFALGFGFLGLLQWIKRKRLLNVDRSILALGVFYITVMAVYILFELVVINYRPILINGVLEASYPSSTTMLTMCIMPTAIIELKSRIKNRTLRCCTLFAMGVFTVFMVVARFLSGVHWLTDIIGGALLSAALVTLFASARANS